MSGSKLFAIIVAAILTSAAVIGVIFAINASNRQQWNNSIEAERRTQDMVNAEIAMMDSFSSQITRKPAAEKLYREWEMSTFEGKPKEQQARLDDYACKVKDMVMDYGVSQRLGDHCPKQQPKI